MKKLLVMMLMVFVLFVLVACNGNDDMVETDDTLINQQEQSEGEASFIDDVASGDGSMTFGNYYTFGDTINLWDRFELVLHDDVIITRPLRTPFPDESEQVHQFYEGYAIKVPSTLTNIEVDGSQNFTLTYVVFGSTGIRYSMYEHLDIGGLMWCPILEQIPGITHDVYAGETIEGYIFLVYDGDGDYWISWSAQDISIRLPISR